MDCKEALKLISAAVDGELPHQKNSEFHNHIDECLSCRTEFEAERATKAMLKSRLKRVKAPQSLVDAIKRQTLGTVGKETNVQFSIDLSPDKLFGAASVTAKPSWKQTLANAVFINPNMNSKANALFAFVLATSVLAMLVFAGFMRHRSNGMFDNIGDFEAANTSNIFELTNTAFAATPEKVESKSIGLKSNDAQVVSNYLFKSIGIHAVVPVVKECTLAAAKVSAFGSINAGEIVFQTLSKNDNKQKSLVSVFVAHEKDVIEASVMPVGVMEYISANGRNFFTTTCSNGNQVIVWKWGETIYTATTADSKLNLAQTVRNPNWEN